MYSAAALLPSTLPRSAMVTAPLSSGAGEAPVRRARCVRIEASSIPAAAASAMFGGGLCVRSFFGRSRGGLGSLRGGARGVGGPFVLGSAAEEHPEHEDEEGPEHGRDPAPHRCSQLIFHAPTARPSCTEEASSRRTRRSPGRDHTPKVAALGHCPRRAPTHPRAPTCRRPLLTTIAA